MMMSNKSKSQQQRKWMCVLCAVLSVAIVISLLFLLVQMCKSNSRSSIAKQMYYPEKLLKDLQKMYKQSCHLNPETPACILLKTAQHQQSQLIETLKSINQTFGRNR